MLGSSAFADGQGFDFDALERVDERALRTIDGTLRCMRGKYGIYRLCAEPLAYGNDCADTRVLAEGISRAPAFSVGWLCQSAVSLEQHRPPANRSQQLNAHRIIECNVCVCSCAFVKRCGRLSGH